jgi:3-oxoacyl-(acyl-carrier-protein) synthase
MFVTDLSCISPQRTYDNTFFGNQAEKHAGNRYAAIEPDYGSLIPAGLLRRMGKAVRMGVGSGLTLIRKNPEVEGIILGTANGGLEDCLKFLNQIVDYNEGTLTPTNFVQSTPNAVAGNLALMTRNTGYNATHVHKGLAFECALLDAMLLFEERKARSLLLGSVEEISDYHYNIDLLSGYYKTGNSTSDSLFTSDSPGTVCGEGAAMFVVEAEMSDRALAQILDVDQISYCSEKQLENKLNYFLERNGLVNSDIDVMVSGKSGDNRTDHLYHMLHNNLLPDSAVYTYKNLTGDYPTSSAFATWMGVQLLLGRALPSESMTSEGKPDVKADHVLVYNHYQGDQHGFVLLKGIR